MLHRWWSMGVRMIDDKEILSQDIVLYFIQSEEDAVFRREMSEDRSTLMVEWIGLACRLQYRDTDMLEEYPCVQQWLDNRMGQIDMFGRSDEEVLCRIDRHTIAIEEKLRHLSEMQACRGGSRPIRRWRLRFLLRKGSDITISCKALRLRDPTHEKSSRLLTMRSASDHLRCISRIDDLFAIVFTDTLLAPSTAICSIRRWSPYWVRIFCICHSFSYGFSVQVE